MASRIAELADRFQLRKRLITDLSIGCAHFLHVSCMSGCLIDTCADSVWASLADTSSGEWKPLLGLCGRLSTLTCPPGTPFTSHRVCRLTLRQTKPSLSVVRQATSTAADDLYSEEARRLLPQVRGEQGINGGFGMGTELCKDLSQCWARSSGEMLSHFDMIGPCR
jgi:hypothetical protein